MDILIVEDDKMTAAVLSRLLRGFDYHIALAGDGDAAWRLFQEQAYPVVISDWMMPGMDGIELCRKVRGNQSRGYTYFILASARDAREDRMKAMDAGADDFIVKPFEMADLTARVRIANRIVGMQAELAASRDQLEVRVRQRTMELAAVNEALPAEVNERKRIEAKVLQAYEATIEGWAHALELRDRYTEGHTRRVTEITLCLARRVGFTGEQLAYIRYGSMLHDIGTMGVPDEILLKPSSLTPQERLVIEQHPAFAQSLLEPIEFLGPALAIPYCHHERWDGSGYPRKLKGEEIPLEARLFALADVWDALRDDRPYRASWSFERVIEHIKREAGTHFDPWSVEQFLQMAWEGDLEAIEKLYRGPARSFSEAQFFMHHNSSNDVAA